MIIKKYGELPTTYAPDVGEVVLARRSLIAKWVRGVVLFVRRRRDGALRIKIQWLEDDPAPDSTDPKRWPIVAGTTGWVIHHPPHSPTIKRLPKASAGPTAAPLDDSAADDLVDGDG